MSEQSTAAGPEPAALDVYVEQAVAALTAAARLAYTTATGVRRHDFGAIACQVLTATAANLGSAAQLLAGRPGSWEADYVRQIVASTAGDEPGLLWQLRTEPVRLVLHPEDVLLDFGVQGLVSQARDAIDANYIAAGDLTDEQAAEIDDQHDRLDALWRNDQTAYAAAYTDTVHAVATELGLTVPVDVTVVLDDAGRASTDENSEPDDDLIDYLHEQARLRTPLPTSGRAPQDYPRGQLPGPGPDTSAAGHAYAARLAAANRAEGAS